MTEILRIYPIVKGQETCIKDPKEILKHLSKTKVEVDLDFNQGGRVKMGTSRDLIGQLVKVGENEFEIPEH
jgi:hypothetical protein